MKMGLGQGDLETGQFVCCGAHFRVVQRPGGEAQLYRRHLHRRERPPLTVLSAGQFIILVIDSTDRERLLTTREELYKMLAHEVSPLQLGESPGY